MKKLLVGLFVLSSISAFSQDTFKITAKTTGDSYSDVYSNWGNMYGRDLVNENGDVIQLVCFVDPNLSNAYEDKTAPGALIDGGIRQDMTLFHFDKNDLCEKMVKLIDDNKGKEIDITFEVSTKNPYYHF